MRPGHRLVPVAARRGVEGRWLVPVVVRGAGPGVALGLVVPGLAVWPVVGRSPGLVPVPVRVRVPVAVAVVVAVLVVGRSPVLGPVPLAVAVPVVGRSLAVTLVVRRSLVVVTVLAEVGRLPVPVVALLVVDRSLVPVEPGRLLVLGPVAAPCVV